MQVLVMVEEKWLGMNHSAESSVQFRLTGIYWLFTKYKPKAKH